MKQKQPIKQAIYRERAEIYDLIYSFKNYKSEAAAITKIIKAHKKTKGKTLLDVGCGTGKHLEFFAESFNCTGVDLNANVLAIAKKRLPGSHFVVGDMTKFRLDQQFDAVITLFSAIGYVRTLGNLKKAIRSLEQHLLPGGVLIIEPWFGKGNYSEGVPHMNTYESDDIKIARLNVSEVIKGNISKMDMHFLVAERDKKVVHFVDQHELGMFSVQETLAILKSVGLNARFQENGLLKKRGLYIAMKPL